MTTTDTIDVAGVTYCPRVVTLADITIDALIGGGSLNQRALLEYGVVRQDGAPIDWDTMPVGHAAKLLPMALAAAGFEAGTAEGNA